VAGGAGQGAGIPYFGIWAYTLPCNAINALGGGWARCALGCVSASGATGLAFLALPVGIVVIGIHAWTGTGGEGSVLGRVASRTVGTGRARACKA